MSILRRVAKRQWCGPAAKRKQKVSWQIGHSGRIRRTGALRTAMLLCLAALVSSTTSGQTPPATTPMQDLTSKSLEDLMNVEVTTVSKKIQKLSEVPAAIFVITQDEIRHSGARNIPDLLRMVPGLEVAQLNANTWAISARGFNSEFAGKLLVLVDGRAVYTPLFGGVSWDTQDVPLEDIERIEVIRGPGGTVWGANAVNGVINVITRKAGDTQGVLVSGGGGPESQGFGTVQYGGNIRDDSNYRVFAKYQNIGDQPDLNGQNGEDGWHLLHGGFRADTKITSKDALTIQGDLYTGSEGAVIVHSVLAPPNNFAEETITGLSGGNLLGRWTRTFSEGSDLELQVYFDRYSRAGPESNEKRDTVDFDFQHHFAWGERQDVLWGVGYRHTADQVAGTIDQAFIPANFSGGLWNFFVQDQVTLQPNRVSLYVGTKLENSFFSGYELEPSIRLAWTPTNRRTLWAAVSRATRTPTRRGAGVDATLAALPGPEEVVLLGNAAIRPEHAIAYELGYRTQLNERLSVDLAAFLNTYSSLESIEPQPSFIDNTSSPPILIIPKLIENKVHGTTEGAEISVNWKISRRWSVSPGYSFLEMHLHTDSSSMDTTTVVDAQGSNPSHQAQLRSHLKLSHGFSWDANGYFVGRLPAQFVASYTRLDSQLVWKFSESAELSVVGQNLLQDHHVEFNDGLAVVNSSQVKRTAYAKLTWRF